MLKSIVLAIVFTFVSCETDPSIPENPFLDDPDHQYEIVKLNTDFGSMRFWLSFQTPAHRENMLQLVNKGFYNGLTFHRVINDFIIQGGDPQGDGTGGPGYEQEAEIGTRLTHEHGALAAARLSDALNPKRRSSGSQFYIVESKTGANFLNGQYTVFGKILTEPDSAGYKTLSTIAAVPKDLNDKPVSPVFIRSVQVERYTRDGLMTSFGFDITRY